jgi:hypothetical protein
MRASILLLISLPLGAQENYFAGFAAGVTTLSADGRPAIDASAAAAALYKPENGLTARLLLGRHINNFLSIEGNYTWNRNALALFALRTAPESAYEQARGSAQHAAGADLTAYFRNRESRLRPYLSVGTGWIRFTSKLEETRVQRGSLSPPPASFATDKPFLRVAVGIDARMGRGWALRYSFAESIQRNPIGPLLTPPGERNLASFQNLFGFIREF